MIASAGPDEWRHVTTSEWRDASTGDADAAPAPRRTGDTTVSDLEVDTDRISFTVDEVGEPVLVKASYFPNWQVSGADGPYRVAPSLMVVVPTDEQVELRSEEHTSELQQLMRISHADFCLQKKTK